MPPSAALGGELENGRALDHFASGDDNRKSYSVNPGIMDRMGVELAEPGEAKTRLAGLWPPRAGGS